jgi:phage tail sheath protein FI
MNLRATVDTDVSEEVAIRMGLDPSDLTNKPNEQLFNLTVRDTSPGGAVERFLNLTVIPKKSRSIDKVLKAESNLVHWDGPLIDIDLPQPILLVHQRQKALAKVKKESPQNQGAITLAQDALDDAKKGLDDNLTKAEKHLAAIKKASEPVAADVITSAEGAVNTAKIAIQASDGALLTKNDFTPDNGESDKKGLYALEKADLFNLLCIPPFAPEGDVDPGLVAEAAVYCEKRRAMLIVDPPSSWTDKTKAKNQFTDPNNDYVGTRSKNAAIFFPRLKQPNPLRDNQVETFVPCGVIAGIFARTDAQRGVWKAPAGLDATLIGVPQLSVPLTDAENGELNPLGINCLRSFPVAGRVVWGARTLRGADQLADEYKYIPVRRLALFIEESLYRGTQWVVFEPNDEPLWAQIRLNLSAFMNNLFRQGAFQGRTPPQNDINLGIVNIVVGFAPLKPAEFVVIKIQQIAGQIAV